MMAENEKNTRKSNNLKIKIIAIVVALCLISSYVIYQAIQISKADMETQFALNETVYKTIETQCFVLRDEEFISNSASGTIVSFAENGERIARGDTVSIVFNSADDATSYLKITELQESIEHYTELSGQGNFQAMDIDSLNSEIENELVDFMEAVDSCDYEDAIAYAESYRDSFTGKQIAVGERLDFTQQLTALQTELDSLLAVDYSYTEVTSDNAGYFISGSDGYEQTLDYSSLDDIDVKDIENAIGSKPATINESVVGRVVGSFNWYFLCVVDSDEIVTLEQNSEIHINIPYKGIERLPVNVHKIGDRNDDKVLLILSCDLMNESLADLRIEDIEIVTEEYTGYKIANSAIRTVDGVKGVYVVRGNLVGFRKINIVYSSENYTIVNNPEGRDDYIKLYDKVVTKGVEIYDNKLV